MKPSACGFLFLAVLSLTGCDGIGRLGGAPLGTSVPENLPANRPAGQEVAVCYSKGAASRDDLAAAAVKLCTEPGSTVEFLTRDLHLNDCPLFKKRRAVFVCRDPR